MFKKLLALSVCAVLAATAALAPAPAQAQTVNYYFISACGVPAICTPNPVWFGPFSSWAQCNTAWALWSTSIYGVWPRSLSSCFAY